MDEQMALLNTNLRHMAEKNKDFETLSLVWNQFTEQVRHTPQPNPESGK